MFVYPLGLACLLLGIALVAIWRRSRWAMVPVGLALAVLLLAGNASIGYTLMRSLEWQYLPPDPVPEADAIVVLGGATKHAFAPRPGVDLGEEGDRLLYAASLYLQGKAPIVLLSGGSLGPSPVAEADNMQTVLVAMGVPPQAIIRERRSLNTYENAIFSKPILTRLGAKQVLLVTSAVHMPRSMAIFQKQGIEAIAAPTDFQVTEGFDGPRPVLSQILAILPDASHLERSTRALKEYIGFVIYRLRGWL